MKIKVSGMANVIIVGGGVSGLVSSISLRRAGIKSRLLEGSKRIGGSKYTYTGLWDPAIKALSDLGLYDDLKAHLQYVGKSGVRSVDGQWLVEPSRPSRPYPGNVIHCLHQSHQLVTSLQIIHHYLSYEMIFLSTYCARYPNRLLLL